MRNRNAVYKISLLMVSTALSALIAQAQASDERDSDELRQETVIVTSRAQQLYRVTETTSGKMPIEPLLSTQAITVINAQLIEDQGARDAQDLYRNISGVSVFSYAGVTARGFRQEENFFDGLRGDPYAGFSVPQLFNVERVEFLKGPAGMLYGAGAPGGLFNYVTKKPSEQFGATASAVYGTEGRKGASVEVTGALPMEGAAGRLGIFYEDQNGPRRNAGSETDIYDAGLSFDLGVADLVLQATRYEQKLGGNRLRGVPTDDLGNFLADRRWNHNEPTDFLDLESNVLQAKLYAEPIEGLTLDAGIRYMDGTERQKYHEPSGLFDSDGDGVIDSSRRQFRDQYRRNEGVSLGTNAVWSKRFGAIDNRVLLGADWYRNDAYFTGVSISGASTATTGLPTPLSLLDPVYGNTDPSTYIYPATRVTETVQTRYGFYALNEATMGPVIAVVGVRQDTFEDKDRVGGTTFEDNATTWRAGLVYRIREDVSLFGQWATSFEPQSVSAQSPLAGGPFEPTEGEIVEGGVKTELLGGRVQTSASVYRIVKTNLLQADPRGDVDGDGVDDQVAFGEITSDGFEADLTADITQNWVGTVSYSYNDARITKTNDLSTIDSNVGDRFANAPENTVGFWTRYQVPAWNTAFAFGGDYVDVRQSLSGQKVRPYMIFDASIIYEIDDWKALLRVDNLFDETYASSGFIDRTGHFPGDPRSVFLEISRKW
ncbi:TonB-dependent siderophore receptor [Hyphomonas oceanitis]|uniref:TonB-dependent siderophore receptor n=1 Tax=Hyphomonas oceanitis SCH89 TaxID=1280953 RepID=A0A059G5S8_9PROT|nr:TonB-dependent siderophore receptor [Hyphomonas oceanitis]KDA01910.1 TonB-dependent siderophore receptor [Hyphomonas oceanitis SCH89]